MMHVSGLFYTAEVHRLLKSLVIHVKGQDATLKCMYTLELFVFKKIHIRLVHTKNDNYN